MLRRFREFWRGRTRPVGAEKFSLSRVSHSSQKTPAPRPRRRPAVPAPRSPLDPAARSRAARWSLRRSRSRAGRASAPPGRGAPRRAAPARRFAGEKVPRKGRARGRRLGARDSAPSAALFHRGVSARGADEADAIALEILTRNGVGVLEVRRERAANASARARTHEHPGAKSCQKKSSSAHFCGTPKSRRISAELDAATSASFLLIGDFFLRAPLPISSSSPFPRTLPSSSTRPFADASLPPNLPAPTSHFARSTSLGPSRTRGTRSGRCAARRTRRTPSSATSASSPRPSSTPTPMTMASAPGAAGGAGGPFGRTVGRTFERPRTVGRPFVRLRRRGRDRGLGHGRDRGAGGAPAPSLDAPRRCFPSAKKTRSKRKYEPTLRPTLPRPRTKAGLSSTPRSRRAR